MDAGHISGRKFPGHSLKELEAALDRPDVSPERREMIAEEIRRRKSGESVAFKVPQIGRPS